MGIKKFFDIAYLVELFTLIILIKKKFKIPRLLAMLEPKYWKTMLQNLQMVLAWF
jgi:hypothetical protein